jgi:proteic killer suppression protein
VEYIGHTNKLAKILSSERLLRKEYGRVKTKAIIQRLSEIDAARTLNDVSTIPPARLHGLHGKYEGLFAVCISKNWRMLLAGFDENDVQIIDKKKVVVVVIVGFEDYH